MSTMMVEPSSPAGQPDPAFRAKAAAYVEAASRGELRPGDPLAREVEARDPSGRFRALALATRDLRQGRPLDAATRLAAVRLDKADLRKALEARIEALKALAASPTLGRPVR